MCACLCTCVRVCIFTHVCGALAQLGTHREPEAGNLINKHMLTLIIDFWVFRAPSSRSMRPCRCAGAGNCISHIVLPTDWWGTRTSSSGLCHFKQKQVEGFCRCLITATFLPHHRQEGAGSEQDGDRVPPRALLAPASHSVCLFFSFLWWNGELGSNLLVLLHTWFYLWSTLIPL